jgi:large subunit ribosomal protein L10
VTKNRLTRRALEGTPYSGLDGLFKGPTAIAYAPDPVAAAKVAVAYAKTNPKLVLLGGSVGAHMLDPDGVRALATLPSLDELRSKLIGLLNAPATRIAGVLQAPAGQLARVFAAYGDTGEAA